MHCDVSVLASVSPCQMGLYTIGRAVIAITELVQIYADYVCHQSILVGHWQMGARVLLLHSGCMGNGYPRCFFSREICASGRGLLMVPINVPNLFFT